MNELPLCPRCSVPPLCVSRPTWWPAIRTTNANGDRFWFWHGCAHARALVPLIPVTDARRAEIETEWEIATGKHFTELTCTWTDAERETFRQKLKT